MTLTDRLHQLARFHREHGLSYVHPKFGEQTMATMVAEIEEAAERIAHLETALRKINSLIDSPARFNAEVQAVLDSVIDTSDVKFNTK